MSYFWLLGYSLVHLLSSLLFLLPIRLYKLIGHLFFFNTQMPNYAKWWFWFVLLPFKVIDVLLFPEIANILFTLTKFNSRRLTPVEIIEAKKVFKNTLPYHLISIDELSFFAWLGSKFNKVRHLGVVTFYSVNFNCKVTCSEQNHHMSWLIHELTHILQFKKMGSSYIFYALYAQHTTGYSLGELYNKKLADFNFEQQAEIVRNYYKNICDDKNKYRCFIEDVLQGNFV